MNEHLIVGRLGADPQLRRFPSGDAVMNFRIATTQYWKDKKSGETKEHTEWHNVVAEQHFAESIAGWARKGSLLLVKGPSRTRRWCDNAGIERLITEIHVEKWMPMHHAQGQQQASDSRGDMEQHQAAAEDGVRSPRKDYRNDGPF